MSAETFLDGRVTMLLGDVRAMLKTLPDDHFDCVVTSPPYWGLRDYGVAGQIGLERTLGEHLDVMVDVFSEVRRVMKPTATLWLNYGDCYASSPNGRSAAETKAVGNDDRTFRDKPFSTVGAIYCPDGGAKGSSGDRSGKTKNLRNHGDAEPVPQGRVVAGGTLKPKDLCMIPNRLAIALQEAGWWVRSEIIWHKPNPMPESIKDRPGSSHEKVWLLSKRERYFYDAAAVAEPVAQSTIHRWAQDIDNQIGSDRVIGKTNGNMKAVGRKNVSHGKIMAAEPVKGESTFGFGETRNLRNVWTIPTAAFSEAHFATFPPELAERCIKAGCPAGGHVLDPFGGSGTSALVAASLGRRATLIELNPEYATLARARIEAAFMGKDEGSRHMVKQLGKGPAPFEAGSLFAGLDEAAE